MMKGFPFSPTVTIIVRSLGGNLNGIFLRASGYFSGIFFAASTISVNLKKLFQEKRGDSCICTVPQNVLSHYKIHS